MNVLANKTILIAPLDWGLGHATRCMPLIDHFLENGAKIILGGNGFSLNLLKDKYPVLPFYELPGYNIQYPVGKNAAIQTLLQAPHILKTIKEEQAAIEKIVSENHVDIILSDNRWGAWSKRSKNIFLCHQVAVQAPPPFGWTNRLLLRYHFGLIKKFDALWIPDDPGEKNLSGKLSHGFSIPIPHSYIGIQSRFSKFITAADRGKTHNIVALLSGAEPQRTFFEGQLTAQLQNVNEDCLLIQGVTDKKEMRSQDRLDIISYMQAEELLPVLQQANSIVCRAGYSTLMDLAVLGKKAILVPTPGQTEQEYLAGELSKKGMAVSVKQENFDLTVAIEKLKTINGFNAFRTNTELFQQAIEKDLT